MTQPEPADIFRLPLDWGRWWTILPEIVALACTALLPVLVGANILSRYTDWYRILWAEDVVKVLFLWVVFLGGAIAVKYDAHVRMSTLSDRLARTGRGRPPLGPGDSPVARRDGRHPARPGRAHRGDLDAPGAPDAPDLRRVLQRDRPPERRPDDRLRRARRSAPRPVRRRSRMVVVGILFVALILLGLPIVASLALTAVIGVAWTQDVPMAVVAARTTSASDNFILLAIPLFMLAGSLMSAGGIAQRLFDLARVLVGHLTGGLAQVNVALSVMIGGIQGSSAADAAIDCKVTIPQMRAEGYPAALSGAITAVSGMLSNIIPPSIAMLIYASMANTSVGKLFVAGIVPGILMALAMSVTVHRICRKMGYGARTRRATWPEVWTALRRSAFALAIPVIDRRRHPLRLLHPDRGRRLRRPRHLRPRHAGLSRAAAPGPARRPRQDRGGHRRHHADRELLGARLVGARRTTRSRSRSRPSSPPSATARRSSCWRSTCSCCWGARSWRA